MLAPDENNQNREEKRQNIGRRIWESMLDADLNARYWKYIGRKQFKKNKLLKIALAIVSVSTIAFSDFIRIFRSVSPSFMAGIQNGKPR